MWALVPERGTPSVAGAIHHLTLLSHWDYVMTLFNLEVQKFLLWEWPGYLGAPSKTTPQSRDFHLEALIFLYLSGCQS